MDIYLSTAKSMNNCSEKIAIMTYNVERNLTFASEAERNAVYSIFGNKNLNINLGDFMWYLSDVFTMGVQYGGRIAMCELFA